jgi:hypothetical protein
MPPEWTHPSIAAGVETTSAPNRGHTTKVLSLSEESAEGADPSSYVHSTKGTDGDI